MWVIALLASDFQVQCDGENFEESELDSDTCTPFGDVSLTEESKKENSREKSEENVLAKWGH